MHVNVSNSDCGLNLKMFHMADFIYCWVDFPLWIGVFEVIIFKIYN